MRHIKNNLFAYAHSLRVKVVKYYCNKINLITVQYKLQYDI